MYIYVCMYICIYIYIRTFTWVSFGHGHEMNFMTGRKWIIIIANKQIFYQWLAGYDIPHRIHVWYIC